LLIQFGDYLKDNAKVYFQFPIDNNTKKGLEEDLAKLETSTDSKTIIRMAFRYIRLSEIYEGSIPKSLAEFVVEIADQLKAVASEIENYEFPYEINANFLKRFISFMIEWILISIDLELREIKPEEDIDHPNNALLIALGSAAHAFLKEAATKATELNDLKKLTDAISALLNMITRLPPKEYILVYNEISTKISTMGENGVIDNGLKEQINRRINQDTEIDQDTE